MSQTVALEPHIKVAGRSLNQILEYKQYKVFQHKGNLAQVKGFENYNHLIDINAVFSNFPNGNLYDRTNRIQGPVKFSPERAWQVPKQPLTLEDALQKRVMEICNQPQQVNILWSGGIDSTTILVAFMKFAPDHRQLRVVYSPFSTYEHPDFFKLLQLQNKIELCDISGDIYLDLQLDGIIVSGNPGDEVHASLDQSFFDTYGFQTLHMPWQDFFYKHHPSDNFIDFCKWHFAASGRDIVTVLDARWWFYLSTKLTAIANNLIAFFSQSNNNFDQRRLVGFFNCDVYEQFIFFNTDQIICNNNYASWRQFLKDFCYSYDGFDSWRVNKTKFSSDQLLAYQRKKQAVLDRRFLFLLDNGEFISTPNLPFFSEQDWITVAPQCAKFFNPPSDV
jgi:hypothetical protein